MRRLLAHLFVLLPLVAAGPTVAADSGLATPLAAVQSGPVASTGASMASDSMLLPMPWQAGNGQTWSLLATGETKGSSPADTSLGFHGLGFASQYGGSLKYMIDPRWSAHARVHEKSWVGAASIGNCLSADANLRGGHCFGGGAMPGLLNGEFGATFQGSGYRVGMGVTTTQPATSAPLLPQIVPHNPLTTSVAGLPFTSLEGSSNLHARGRLALGEGSGIDFGASVGRIRLLPGNVLGIDTLGQKSLSFGLDSGAVSGRIVGRIVQPETGVQSSMLGPDHRWTSIDLGVTWHLPWQGSLSFGTQNLWTSGHAPKPKQGPQPDESRIPYVQYHQDF